MSLPIEKATTTQTGPDFLCLFEKEDALKKLESLWKLSPLWIPRTCDDFFYPFMDSSSFSACTGNSSSIPKEWIPLLDIQKNRGYLIESDMTELHQQLMLQCINISGTLLNNVQSNRFLLDPIKGSLFRIPCSSEGRDCYFKFYMSRSQFISAIPSALYFLKTPLFIPEEDFAAKELARTIVIICGLGTGGGETALRLGKQVSQINLVLIDGGVFGPENIDRQLVTPSELGMNKAIAVASKIFQVHPLQNNVFCIPRYINCDNAKSIFNSILNHFSHIKDPIIQFVDEVDVTEEETLKAKAALHESVCNWAKELGKTIPVHWSLDVGASAEIVGTCQYDGNESNIFNGEYSRKMALLPAIFAVLGLVPPTAIGVEMLVDIRKRMKSDARMDHISQTGLSAIGVAKTITTRIILCSLGFSKHLVKKNYFDDLRHSLKWRYRLRLAFRTYPKVYLLAVWGRWKRQQLLRNL
ncbi:MAG: ThiF family adenylyltransferase [Bacteroidales bacterium]|nr:ThiF family adenylyltransferase [Bacteroidales bacterium]